MKKYLMIFWVLFLFLPPAQAATGKQSREGIVSQKLDCLSQSQPHSQVGWTDVCETVPDATAAEIANRQQKIEDALTESIAQALEHPVLDPNNSLMNPQLVAETKKTMSVTVDAQGNVTAVPSDENDMEPAADELQVRPVPQAVMPIVIESVTIKDTPAVSAFKPVDFATEQSEKINPGSAKNNRPANKIADRDRQKTIELGLQLASYHYQTDGTFPYFYSSLYSVENRVENNGYLGGIYGSYTHYFSQNKPVHSWGDLWKGNDFPNVVKVEGDASWGREDYDSYATGKLKDLDIWNLNARALFGYDLPNDDLSFVLTPYTGIGYRRFSDKGGAWIDFAVRNYAQFERISHYFYIPLGFEALKHVNNDWDVSLKMEGDALIYGWMRFNHHDAGGIYTITDVSTGDPEQVRPENTTSKLRGGFGFRSSLKAVKKYDEFNIFIEPFIEYWNILKSKEAVAKDAGLNGVDYHSVAPDPTPIWEPKNTSTTCGVRLGMQF